MAHTVEVSLKDILGKNETIIIEQFDGEFCTIVRIAYQLCISYSKSNNYIGPTGVHELTIAVTKDIIPFLRSKKLVTPEEHDRLIQESNDLRKIESLLHNFEVLCPLRRQRSSRNRLYCPCP